MVMFYFFRVCSGGKKYVKLNVGGSLFQTTLQTLVSSRHSQGSMLQRMFSGTIDVLTDEEGLLCTNILLSKFLSLCRCNYYSVDIPSTVAAGIF